MPCKSHKIKTKEGGDENILLAFPYKNGGEKVTTTVRMKGKRITGKVIRRESRVE